MTIRQPRAWLSVGGNRVVLKHCEATVSRDMMASTFMATMALDHPSNPGAMFWSQETPIPASIIGTNDIASSAEKTLLEGKVDIVEIKWATREVIVEGSDLMSDLADTRSAQSFPNMTKTQALQTILAKHGFNLHIDAVSEMAGKTWDGQDWAHITDNENELDVVHSIVQSMGKTAFAVGKDFYVTDFGNVVGNNYNIVYRPELAGIPPQLNGQTLITKRNVQLSQISAKVASYPPYEKQPYVGDSNEPNDASPSGAGGSSQGFDETGFE